MKFAKVDSVPEKKRYHRLKDCWEEFMCMNIKIAKANLDVNEYKNVTTARSVMTASIKRFGYPISVMRRGNDIYLVRRDI